MLRSVFRKSDIVARLGGDEFVILCTDGAIEPTAPVTRLEEVIQHYNALTPPRPFTLSISIGSTTHDPEQPEPVDVILKRADQEMYENKARREAARGGKYGGAAHSGGWAARAGWLNSACYSVGDVDRLLDPVTVDHGGDGGLVVVAGWARSSRSPRWCTPRRTART